MCCNISGVAMELYSTDFHMAQVSFDVAGYTPI